MVGCDCRGIVVWIVPGNFDVDVVDFGGDGSGYLGRFVCSCDSGDVGIVAPSVLVLGSVAELIGRTLGDSFLRICHDIL